MLRDVPRLCGLYVHLGRWLRSACQEPRVLQRDERRMRAVLRVLLRLHGQ